jgi:hypothetical protein
MKKHKIEINWPTSIIWGAGALFTLGYSISPGDKAPDNFLEQVALALILYILWPLILGAKMSGNF